MARLERDVIFRAIESAGGNRAVAARALGISDRWMLKTPERYGLPAADDVAVR